MLGPHLSRLAQNQVLRPIEQMGTPRLGGAATWGLPSRISLLHSFRGCYLTENSVHGAPYHVEQHARTRHLQAFWLLKLGEQDKL